MQVKRRNIFIVFWALLIYMAAALIWWYILLNAQNKDLKNTQTLQLVQTVDSAANPLNFSLQKAQIAAAYNKKQRTYVMEGLAFLLLITIGAILVYKMVLKQFKLASQQHNFMMAVTHELKTPIAVAQLNLQTINKHNLEPNTQKQLINNTLAETQRLDQLATNILITSKLDGGAYKLVNDEVAVDNILKQTVQRFTENFSHYNFSLVLQNECTIFSDVFLLQILINNLMSNAVKYSSANTLITVTCFNNGFSIADQGLGISDADKKLVFKKFMRLGNEDTRSTKGTGIGLYLCNRIAKDLNGQIAISNNIPKGTVFTITFNN
jgi:two-component system, OmpR family, sensor histidine kinase CiaH